MTSVLDAAADDGACRASVGFAAVLVGEIRHGDEAAIANVLVAGHRAFTDQELLGAVAALIRALTDEIARLSGLDVAEVDRNLAAQDRDAVLRSIGRCGSRSRRI